MNYYVTKYCKVYEVSYDRLTLIVNSLPSHYFLAYMARRFGVPLDRVRVKFKGFRPVVVPLFESDDLSF